MSVPDVLDLPRLRAGLFVEYLGETGGDMTSYVGAPPSRCRQLWHAHPGVIRDAAMQHVQVDWVGLEDVAESLWVGFSCNDDGRYPGLGAY